MRTLITLASIAAAGLAPFLVPPAALPVALAPTRPEPPPAAATTQDADMQVQVEAVAGGVHVLYGQGGNVAVHVGDDGVLMVDAQYEPMAPALLAAAAELADGAAPRFLVNTHWHGDHVGGNAPVARTGAVVVAHDNVHARMSTDQVMAAFGREVPAAPRAAQPVISYDEALGFHWNGDTVRVVHAPNAHTDGDSILHWEGADVVHTGDTFFNGMYPFIDAGSGGHIDGMIAAAERVLALCGDGTRVIPGHGSVGGKADVQAYRDMLATVSERLHAHVDAGLSDDEIVAAKPTADLDEVWGGGFMAPDRWVQIVLMGLR